MTVEDRNCFHCDQHYVTGDDMTREDTELCPSCDNQGMLIDCVKCDAPTYISNDSEYELCRCCYVRQAEGIKKPDVLFVMGQGHLKLEAFGETTEDTYFSKMDLVNAIKGFSDFLSGHDTIHVDIVIDTAHQVGGISSHFIEEKFHATRLIEGLYNIAIMAYEEISTQWIKIS